MKSLTLTNSELIFGSVAAKYWFPDFREPKDIDIISLSKLKTKGKQHYYIPEFEYIFQNNNNSKYVNPVFLYTIKVSHAAWDINWTKTMKDIEFFQKKGITLDMPLYSLLYKRWEKIHGSKKVKMNMNNADFFTNTVKRKYSHDWLHEQIAFGDRPLHEKIRKNLNSPLCSVDLWNNLPEDEKLKCALEELYVLTLERYIFIDNPLPIKTALVHMLKRMITSTTSGWFNLYLIDNFHKIRTYPTDYIENKLRKF